RSTTLRSRRPKAPPRTPGWRVGSIIRIRRRWPSVPESRLEQVATPTHRIEAGPPLVEVRGVKKYFPLQSGFLASLFNRGEQPAVRAVDGVRSEEHTSELQSRENLVCRLLLEKKN